MDAIQNQRTKKSSWLLGSILIAIVLVVVLSIWPGSKPDRLNDLKPGMTKAEVQQLLGRPRERHHYADGTSNWIYPDGFHDPFVVEFDREERYQSFY